METPHSTRRQTAPQGANRNPSVPHQRRSGSGRKLQRGNGNQQPFDLSFHSIKRGNPQTRDSPFACHLVNAALIFLAPGNRTPRWRGARKSRHIEKLESIPLNFCRHQTING
ncbi:MAG: hypothetical protein RR240_07205 [Burkholderiaceae bacterium]